MLADIHDKNGKLAWKTLFEDAIFYAKSFKFHPRLNKMLGWAPHIYNDEY